MVVAGVLASALWLSRAEGGQLPPGVSVSGVDIGDQSVEEARTLLLAHAQDRLARELILVFPGGEYRTDAEDLGLEPALDVVLSQAETSRSAFSRLKARLGVASSVELSLEYRVEPAAIRKVVAEIAEIVNQPMRSATIRVLDERIVTEEAQPGYEIDNAELFELLRDLPERVVVPVAEVQPVVTNATVEAAKARAEALTSEPPTVVFRSTRVELAKGLMLRSLRFRRDGSEIAIELDSETLARRLREGFSRFERVAQDATFELQGGSPRVVPSRVGRRFAVAATVDAVLAGAGRPQVRAVFRTRQPSFTTEKARELGILEQVGAFATEYACCPPRVTNIKRAAAILDGTFIGPGETFSLNSELGERTEERGFVAAPMIGEGGKLVDAVGGGVSQIATTLFNAAFFSGLDLVTHTPHSFYISRYPEGREATVSWGAPELVFRNDWSSAVLMRVVASDTAVWVTFFSAKLGRRVETTTGERFDPVPAETVEEENLELEPGERNVLQTGGTPGFSIAYTRKVFRGEEVLRDERWVTRYDPANTIVEVGPPEKKNPKKDADSEADQEPTADSGDVESNPEGDAPVEGDPPADTGPSDTETDPESAEGDPAPAEAPAEPA